MDAVWTVGIVAGVPTLYAASKVFYDFYVLNKPKTKTTGEHIPALEEQPTARAEVFDTMVKLMEVKPETEIDLLGRDLEKLQDLDYRCIDTLSKWLFSYKAARINYYVFKDVFNPELIKNKKEKKDTVKLAWKKESLYEILKNDKFHAFLVRRTPKTKDLIDDLWEHHFAIFSNPDQLWLGGYDPEFQPKGEHYVYDTVLVRDIENDSRYKTCKTILNTLKEVSVPLNLKERITLHDHARN